MKNLISGAQLMLGLLIVLGACSLQGCSALPFLGSSTGQVVLTSLADIAVGLAEQHGLPAAEIQSLGAQLASVDYSTPTSLATAVPMIQAHGANVPLVDQKKLTILASAIGQAVNATHPTDANSVQTSTGDLLQSIVTASSPNPKAPANMSRPISHTLKRRDFPVVNCWDANSGYTRSCTAATPQYARLEVSN